VALQFSDELLNNSIRVMARLREKCQNDAKFFILADTSYGRFYIFYLIKFIENIILLNIFIIIFLILKAAV
jgi:hypothetical protein